MPKDILICATLVRPQH